MPPHMLRLIRALEALTLASLVALPALVVWVALSPEISLALPAPAEAEALVPPGPGRRLAVLGVGAIPAAALVWALACVLRLLSAYRRGDIFGASSSRHIRHAGQALLAFAALRFLAHPVQSVLVTLDNPPGSRVLAVSAGHADVGLLLAGGLLLVIGWVTGQAAALAEDNAGFV